MATIILAGQRKIVRRNGKSLQAGGKPGSSTQETSGLESNTLGGGSPEAGTTDSSTQVNRIHGGNKNGNKSNSKNQRIKTS